jgi:hypothetical protein
MLMMATQLHETYMINTTYGKVCFKQKKLPIQSVELQCSPLQTSMLKGCNNYSCTNSSHSNIISSMLLATRNCHGHLQHVHMNL